MGKSFYSSLRLASMQFTSLVPSTTYHLYCSTESWYDMHAFEVEYTASYVVSTSCCRSIFVDLAYPRLLEVGKYYTSFATIWSNSKSRVGFDLALNDASSSLSSACKLSMSLSVTAGSPGSKVLVDIHSCQSPGVFRLVVNATDDSFVSTTSTSFAVVNQLTSPEEFSHVSAEMSDKLNQIVIKFNSSVNLIPFGQLQFNCSDVFIFPGKLISFSPSLES